MTTLLLTLTLLSAPVDVDKLDAKTASKIAATGVSDLYKDSLHKILQSIFADAQQGHYRADFYVNSVDKAEYIRGKLSKLNYGVTVVKDYYIKDTWLVTVRWDI